MVNETAKTDAKELPMNVALICHDPATGRITVHELPTVAVIEPCAPTKEDRMWAEEVEVRFTDGSMVVDTDPGHAIMEVLGLYAEDDGVPRWRRRATGMPVPKRPEVVIVNPSEGESEDP